MTTVHKKRVSNVLLVGVDQFVNTYLCNELCRYHCYTHVAVSAEEGLKFCGTREPSVIVVDLLAKDQNCLSAIATLRAMVGKTVPIIALSPSADRIVIDHAIRMGATYCLPMQYDREPLADFILGLLNLRNESVGDICELKTDSGDFAYGTDAVVCNQP